MARKRTKAEALEKLASTRQPASRGLPKRAKLIHDAAYLGAAGLIMLDPFNRLADERIVLPLDMVCIPAYQAYMIEGTPSMQIYVRAGETIIPTGGNVRDVEEALEEGYSQGAFLETPPITKRKKAKTAYQGRYKKAFKQVESKHRRKDGSWKKGGFRKAVKEAHALLKAKKK